MSLCRSLRLSLLLLCLPARALAQDGGLPDDAPLLEAVQSIRGGQPAPSDGIFMTNDRAGELLARCRQAQIERTELRAEVEELADASFVPSPWLLVGVFLAGVAGTVVVYEVKK